MSLRESGPTSGEEMCGYRTVGSGGDIAMPRYDTDRIETIAQQCLQQADGDKKKAAQLFRKRIDASAALKVALLQLLLNEGVWDAIRELADDAVDSAADDEIQEEQRLRQLTRKRFERQIAVLKLLPFPGRRRRLDLIRELGELRELVRSSIGSDCQLFRVLDEALDTKKLSDIRYALVLYEAQPCSVLDRVWALEPYTHTPQRN